MSEASKRKSFVSRYIAEGFRNDAMHLLHKFVALNSFKFEDFRKVFKEMRFSLVYTGRHNATELSLFTQEIFLVTLSLLQIEASALFKTGIVFLLYSLYFVQPFTKYSIRILFDQFEELDKIAKFGLRHKNISPAATLRALLKAEAFSFVATERPMGVMSIPPAAERKNSKELDSLQATSEISKAFLKDGKLSQLDSMMKSYNEKIKNIDFTGLKGFTLETTDRFDFAKLERELKSHYRFDVETTADSEAASASAASAPEEVDDIGYRRRMLKQMMFRGLTMSMAPSRPEELDSDLSIKEESSGDDELPMVIEPAAKNKKKKKKETNKKSATVNADLGPSLAEPSTSSAVGLTTDIRSISQSNKPSTTDIKNEPSLENEIISEAKKQKKRKHKKKKRHAEITYPKSTTDAPDSAEDHVNESLIALTLPGPSTEKEPTVEPQKQKKKHRKRKGQKKETSSKTTAQLDNAEQEDELPTPLPSLGPSTEKEPTVEPQKQKKKHRKRKGQKKETSSKTTTQLDNAEQEDELPTPLPSLGGPSTEKEPTVEPQKKKQRKRKGTPSKIIVIADSADEEEEELLTGPPLPDFLPPLVKRGQKPRRNRPHYSKDSYVFFESSD